MGQEIILSVIIPVYNGEKYLERLIKVLKEQTFQKFEVLFIDDGSTDDTYRLCRNYAVQYSHVRLIHTENNGVSHARNIGIKEAKGKWIQFMDVDDIIHNNMFSTFYKALEDSGSDMAVCGCIRRDAETKAEVLCGPEENRPVNGKELIQLFAQMKMEQRYWLLDYIWNKWYKRELIESCHIRFPENLSLGEDFVFNAQYFQHISSLEILSDCCYEYEVHESGLVSRFQETPWDDRKILYDKQRELYRSMGIWDSSRREIRRQYGQIFWGDIRRINSRNCHYNGKEKQQYIKKMISSDLYDMMLEYLQSRQGKAYRIYEVFLRSRRTLLIYGLIKLEKFISQFFVSQRGKNM